MEVFYDALITRVSALPGVRSVGGVEQLPLSGPQQTSDFRIIGAPPPPQGDEPDAAYASVTPGYFAAMSLVLRRGRTLTESDGFSAPRVAVINEAMARRFWLTRPDRQAGGAQHRVVALRPLRHLGSTRARHGDRGRLVTFAPRRSPTGDAALYLRSRSAGVEPDARGAWVAILRLINRAGGSRALDRISPL
jgi:hypothetical protein